MMMSKRRSRTSPKRDFYALHYFQVYCFEKHRKGCLNLSQGITFPFGIGLAQQAKEDVPNEIQLAEFIIDETLKVENDYYYV
jgi:hypothetical protein